MQLQSCADLREAFWVNPFGVDFNRINKSDLLRVDHKGNILDHGRVKVLNKAAFLIHGAIHAARPDVMCAAHTHSVYGRAFCTLGKPLDPISLESCIFYDVSKFRNDSDMATTKQLII